MRDATNSWSGYIYQSVIGLIVALESFDLICREESVFKLNLVFEDHEDFSIYLYSEAVCLLSQTHQVKYLKSKERSEYYDALRNVLFYNVSKNGINHYLNLSEDIDFSNCKLGVLKNKNLNQFKYIYTNGNSYLSGSDAFSYLSQLVAAILKFYNEPHDNSKIESFVSYLITNIDKTIVSTKEKRKTNFEYREIIDVQTLILGAMAAIKNLVTEEVLTGVIKQRISKAYYLYVEALSHEDNNLLSGLFEYLMNLSSEELLDFIIKIEPHKVFNTNFDFLSSFAAPEELQDILLRLAAAYQISYSNLTIDKNSKSYRPTTLRFSSNAQVAGVNLTKEYIPKIISNMSIYDVQSYFNTDKLVVAGNSIPNIWNYHIPTQHQDRTITKINEPNLKSFIDIEDAVKELDEN